MSTGPGWSRLRSLGLAARLALTFAAVAVGTAAAVAIAAPPIVGRGFAMMQAGQTPGAGNGMGPGMGAGMGGGGAIGTYLAQAQQEATLTIAIVALVAAVIASLIGIVIARRIAGPLEHLEAAAAAVAAGDLSVRSGLAQRGDEMGSLGRSFDAMAVDLERNEAARRRFFADAAHEMKTPLAVIDATAAAVMDGVYAHDERHLATIREQARLLRRVVDDLRTISLAEAGALPLQRSSLTPADVAATVAASFAARADAARVALRLDVTDRRTVTADRDRLAQALGALLDNALRHVPAGGAIDLSVGEAPDPARVRIAVADTGPGFVAHDLPHVFDRFYQADAARDRGTATSGLGLSITRAIVEAHGGTAGAANRPEGGALVWLELPAG